MGDNRKAVFDRYLRQLKAGGRTNMYGAVPYLMKTFDLDRNTAFAIVCEWIDRQSEPCPPGRGRVTAVSQRRKS
jgi:hypothetical protein